MLKLSISTQRAGLPAGEPGADAHCCGLSLLQMPAMTARPSTRRTTASLACTSFLLMTSWAALNWR